MKNLIGLKKIILFAGDLAVLYFSLYVTLTVRYWQIPTPELWETHLTPFSVVFVVWILIFYIAGLYNLHLAVNNTNFFKLTFRSLTISGLLSLAFFYLTPQITIAPKRNLLIYIAVFYVLFYLWRRIYNGLLKSYLPKNNIAIIGINNLTLELINELAEKSHLGYKIMFIIDDKHNQDNINNIPVFRNAKNLSELIKKKNIDTIILTSSPHDSDELRSSLFKCLPLKINYISLPHFYENLTGKISVESLSKMWFLENLSEGNKQWFNLFKRIYDFTLSLVALTVSVIFWPILAIIIKLESKGPVLFKQTRSGINGKEFKILKFRTMTNTNNDYSPTIHNDKRITKFGSFLRKSRIDEIPQIINIIKGEMSFVGPRPERPELIKGLEEKIPFYNERMLVKPGVTGWDQISGEYHSPSYEDSLKKLQYDLFYIKNRSIYLDLSIILRTIATVVSRGGR